MTLRSVVATSGDLVFTDEELGDMRAAIAGEPGRRRFLVRVPSDEAARPQAQAGSRRPDSALPVTAQQPVFNPLDLAVESAFDAVRPPPPRASAPAPRQPVSSDVRGVDEDGIELLGTTPSQPFPAVDAKGDALTVGPASAASVASPEGPSPASTPPAPALTSERLQSAVLPSVVASVVPSVVPSMVPAVLQSPVFPSSVFDDPIYCSAPRPDASVLLFELPQSNAAAVVVASSTPRRDAIAAPPGPVEVALRSVETPRLVDVSHASEGSRPLAHRAAAHAHKTRDEDGEELDGAEMEEVPAPVVAAPLSPVAASSAPAVVTAPATPAESPRPRRAPSPPPTPPGSPAPPEKSTGTVPEAAATDASDTRVRRRRRGKPWFEEIFDEDYLHTLPFVTAEQTDREVGFLAQALKLESAATILDIGCGQGRHALELAARGHAVTGIDLSLALLGHANDTARAADLAVEFVHGDMRDMGFEARFDAAYCYSTTFGFFEDEANRNVAVQMARALKPGGRLLLDVVNRDYLIGELPTRVWWQGTGGCMVLEEVDFNYYTSRIQSRRSVVFENGRQLEQDISIRAYSLHEIGKLLHHAGFRVTEVSGGLSQKGRFFGAESRQILIAAEKK